MRVLLQDASVSDCDGTVGMRKYGRLVNLQLSAAGKIIKEIRSGGQTGVDRAALDAALELGIRTAGYVPLGRSAEDGRIPDVYPGLVEIPSADPLVRTAMNIDSSDGTLLISRGDLIGGSAFTLERAASSGKPVIHVDLSIIEISQAAAKVAMWITDNKVRILNIAGPRASDDPKIYGYARELIKAILPKK